jgi:hypothetical protein
MNESDESTPAACPDCHALVADLEAHKHWHQRLVTDLANAVARDFVRHREEGT